MNFEAAYDIIDKIPGWMGKVDAMVLFKYAKKIKGQIVEIGPYAGRSTKLMAIASPESSITTIDDFSMGQKKRFLKEIDGYDISFLIGKSQDIGKKWKQPIDLLHIDGDHTYEAVRKDIELFAPHVKPGGYILLHDYWIYGNPERIIQRWRYDGNDRSFYNDKKYGVVKAVDKCRKLLGEISTEGGFAVCRKS